MIKDLIKKILPRKILRSLQLTHLYEQMTYTRDGLYTIHSCSFLEEKDFKKAYAAGKRTGSWGDHDIEWRVHTVLWAAKKGIGLEGDFVECGVNKGGLARSIVEYLDFKKLPKKFYLLDTFEGFDMQLLLESEKKKYENATGYGKSYLEVKETFKEFSNVEIIKGAVPFTLSQVPSEKVAFLSIDMNCVQPELAALDFFWPKIVSGGVIVLDDFAYAGYSEQNTAHTNWAKNNGVDILTMATGQGIIIKK